MSCPVADLVPVIQGYLGEGKMYLAKGMRAKAKDPLQSVVHISSIFQEDFVDEFGPMNIARLAMDEALALLEHIAKDEGALDDFLYYKSLFVEESF